VSDNSETLEIIASFKDASAAGIDSLSKQLKGVSAKVDDAGKHVGGFKSVLQGIGQGVGQAAFGLVDSALDKTIGFLSDSSKAYQDAQISQQNLALSLKNNVPNWDGSTKAIEASTKAGTDWGFSANDVRNSLGQLVGITHDVGKAQADLTLAQNLARAKNIDLATATDIVTKAAQGNGKALKALGIDTTGVKDAAGYLDAIQKNVKGSAEEWAKTNEGKTAVSNAKLQESMEKVGKVVSNITTAVLPPLIDAFSGIVNVISDDVIPAVEPIVDAFGKQLPGAIATVQGFINGIIGTFKGAGGSASGLGKDVSGLGKTFSKVFADIKSIVDSGVKIVSGLWKTFGGDITKYVKVALQYVQETFQNALKFVQGLFDTFAALFRGDWSGVWNGIKEMFGAVWDQIGSIFKAALGIFPILLDAAGKVLGAIWDGIWTALKTAIRVAWDAIIGIIKFELGLPGQLMKAAFDGLVKIVTGMPGAIAGAAKGMFDGISGAFKAAVNFIINGWNGIKFGIPGFDLGPIHYGGFSLGVPHIPTLHTGGVVPGLPGTEVRANLLERRG
jgi:phage-related protein